MQLHPQDPDTPTSSGRGSDADSGAGGSGVLTSPTSSLHDSESEEDEGWFQPSLPTLPPLMNPIPAYFETMALNKNSFSPPNGRDKILGC